MKLFALVAALLLISTQAFAGAGVPIRTPIYAAYVYVTPSTGNTVTINANDPQYVVAGGSTLSTLTISLPNCTAAFDGAIHRVTFEEAVTTLTVSTTSGSVTAAKPAAAAIGSEFTFICRGSDTTWHIG